MYKQIEQNKRRSTLMIIAFIAVIIGLGWVFGQVYEGGYAFTIGAVAISIISSIGGYYFSDSIVLAASRAKQIQKSDAPQIWNLVENLSITAGLPMPRVYIIEDRALNAFATGRDPEHAAIALTTGIITALEKTELEGVIAHELSHVKNYDIRIATLAVVFVGIITLLADWFVRFSFFGRSRDDNNGGGQLGAILAIIGLVLAILSPIFARLIQLSLSRKREYLADASGALLTRYPDGLANALRKIAGSSSNIRSANKATAHLFFANPFRGKRAARLFSTHPPIEDRIRELEEMGRNLN